MTEQWRENAEDALENDTQIKPMWLRANGDDYTEFAAHIDYIVPCGDEAHYIAAIDVSSDGGHSEIQAILPSKEGTGEPMVVMTEPYSLTTLEQAIALIEAHANDAPY